MDSIKKISKTTKFRPEELKVAEKIGITEPIELERFLGEYFCVNIIEKLNAQQMVDHSRRVFEQMVEENLDLETTFPKFMALYHLYKIVEVGIMQDKIAVLGECVVPSNKDGIGAPLENIIIFAKLEKGVIVPNKSSIEKTTEKIREFGRIVENKAKKLGIMEEDEGPIFDKFLSEDLKEIPRELNTEDTLEMLDREYLSLKDLPEGTIYRPKKMRDASIKISLKIKD